MDGAKVAIGIAITFIWAVQNVIRIDYQGWINNAAVFLQMTSIIVISIVIFAKNPITASAKDVFTSTYNGTGFPFGYVSCIGIVSTLFAFSGYEGLEFLQFTLIYVFHYF